ncbi:MAG: GGDEF domain-containing protein [Gemmatimonadales bacterium]
MSLGYEHSRRKSRAISGTDFLAAPPGQPIWRRLLTPPDPLHMDAGAEGEMIVARVRTILVLLLLPIPLINLLLDENRAPGLVGLAVNLVALGVALGVQQLLRRDFYRPWLGLATSLLDVTLVGLGLGAFLLLGQPITTVNSRLLFEVYFVAIGATALRFDTRISMAAGAMAFLQYLGLVLIASLMFDLKDPALALTPYGTFDWATQVSRLVLLGVMTLLAVAIVRRSQRLRRQSRSDRLTGLPNRSFFDERVLAELSRARRYSEPVALAMIDVDHFKQFNDAFGHAAGDIALRAVARAIEASVRQSDLVVRYGGEEFVVLLPGMDATDAMARVEGIRAAVAALPIGLPRRSEVARITISIGLAVLGADGTEAEDLLDRADARLFEAKQGGRDRVVGPPSQFRTSGSVPRISGEQEEEPQVI